MVRMNTPCTYRRTGTAVILEIYSYEETHHVEQSTNKEFGFTPYEKGDPQMNEWIYQSIHETKPKTSIIFSHGSKLTRVVESENSEVLLSLSVSFHILLDAGENFDRLIKSFIHSFIYLLGGRVGVSTINRYLQLYKSTRAKHSTYYNSAFATRANSPNKKTSNAPTNRDESTTTRSDDS